MRTKLLSAFIVCFLFFGIFSGSVSGSVATASHENSALFADEATTVSFRKTVTVNFGSGEDINFKWDFVYDDLFFKDSSYIYNHDLAKISFGLALAAGNPTSTHTLWGETGDNIGRHRSVEKLYNDLEFVDKRYYNYDSQLNDSDRKIAFSIAKKDVHIGEDNFTLIAVAIRGYAYGAEWSSNFDMGKDGYSHKGFTEAATEVQEAIIEYFEEFEDVLDEDTKLWLVGYSRGANVSNLLGSNLDKLAKGSTGLGRFLDPKNIYVYTFAPSRIVSSDNNPDFQDNNKALFDNIFNIINPNDVMTTMPPKEWNLTRYGVNKVFLFGEHLTSFKEDPLNYDLVDSIYEKMSGEELSIRDFSSFYLFLEDVEKLVLILMPNASSYEDNYREAVMELVSLTFSRVPDDSVPMKWKALTFKDRFMYHYGSKGRLAYIRMDAFVSMLLFKMSPQLLLFRLPQEEIYSSLISFLALCDMYELKIQNILDFVIEAFRTLRKYDFSVPGPIVFGHYPEIYIAWLFSQTDPDLLFI